jgi:sRNA-binding protein
MTYRFMREETELAIEKLAELYPKCFFVNSRNRAPLKKNIILDLQRDGAPMAAELLSAALDWYQSHLGYQLILLAGAKRVGLHGEWVGTVTPSEALAAQKTAAENRAREKARREAQQVPIVVEMIKKVEKEPTPMTKTPVKPPSVPEPAATPSDPLAGVQALIDGVRTVMTTSPPALRAPLAKAGLHVVADEIQKMIAGMDKEAA